MYTGQLRMNWCKTSLAGEFSKIYQVLPKLLSKQKWSQAEPGINDNSLINITSSSSARWLILQQYSVTQYHCYAYIILYYNYTYCYTLQTNTSSHTPMYIDIHNHTCTTHCTVHLTLTDPHCASHSTPNSEENKNSKENKHLSHTHTHAHTHTHTHTQRRGEERAIVIKLELRIFSVIIQ